MKRGLEPGEPLDFDPNDPIDVADLHARQQEMQKRSMEISKQAAAQRDIAMAMEPPAAAATPVATPPAAAPAPVAPAGAAAPGPQLLGETSNAFHVQNADGSQMTIPKNAIGMNTANIVRGLPAAAGGQSIPTASVPSAPPTAAAPPPQATPIAPAATAAAPAPATGTTYQQLQAQTAKTGGQISGDLKGLAGAVEKQKSAIDEQGKVQARTAEDIATQMGRSTEGLQQHDAETVRLQNLHQQAVDTDLKKLLTLHDDLSKMNVDPNRLVGRGTMASIVAGAMVGLNALGNAIAGNAGAPNNALHMILGGIDRDIDAQKTAIQGMHENLAARKNLLGLSQQMFQDQNQQRLATRMQMVEMAKAKIDQLAMANRSPEALANAQAMKAGLDAEMHKMAEGFHLASGEQASRNLGIMAGIENNQLDYQARMAAARQAAGAAAGKYTIPGLVGAAKDEVPFKEAVKMEGSYQAAMPMLQKLKEHVEKAGTTVPGSESDVTGKAMADKLHLELKNLAELGVLAGPDMDLLEKLVPANPGKLGYVMPQLEQAEDYIKTKANAYLRVRGYSARENAGDIPGGFTPSGGAPAQAPAAAPSAPPAAPAQSPASNAISLNNGVIR